MRRRKHRFPLSSDKSISLSNGSSGHQSGGSSEGPDPSSSDLSADTVIYVGPCEETDGEHPPVYLPSLSSGDNRCVMSKALRGSGVEGPKTSPMKTLASKNSPSLPVQNSPKRQPVPKIKASQSPQASPKKQPLAVSKSSNIPTPKNSPMKRNPQEQWIDGPRISKTRVAEARHLLREINHVKQNETWIDGPSAQPTATSVPAGYGFMDNHKKCMIRQWVENQSSQLYPQIQQPKLFRETREVSEDIMKVFSQAPADYMRTNLKHALENLASASSNQDNTSERASENSEKRDGQEEEDQDSGPSEVPPALPLMNCLGSREISHESISQICSRRVSRDSLIMSQQNAEMMDCGLQVTEDDIMQAMGIK